MTRIRFSFGLRKTHFPEKPFETIVSLLFCVEVMTNMEDEKGDEMMLDTSRKQSGDRTKLYKQMLLKEIPGIYRGSCQLQRCLEFK